MRQVFLPNTKNVIHYLKDFSTAFSTKNTIAAPSDARPVSMYFEIIWATWFHTNLLISVSLSEKKHLVHLLPCFVLFFSSFTRIACSVHLISVASGPNWIIKSRVKYRPLESRIPELFLIPSLCSFRSRQLKSALLQHTAIFIHTLLRPTIT